MPEEARWTTAVLGFAGLYVVLVPSTTPYTSLGLFNEKRVLQIALLVVVGVALLASRPARRQWLATVQSLPVFARVGLAVVLALGVLSATQAPSPFFAFLEVGHVGLLFVLAGGVAAAVRQAPEWAERVLLGAIVVSVGLYAVHFGVSYALSVAWPALEVGRETITGFANIRHFNQYQTWTLPLLAAAIGAIPRRFRAARAGVFALLALWWSLVLASDVRGTVVAMGIAVGLVALVFRGHSYRWLAIQAVGGMAGGLLYYVLFDLAGGQAPQVVNRLGQASADSWRIQRWTKSVELAWAQPWLGVGPMHFAWLPFHGEPGAHPHSAFFQWLAEWGLPSAVLMSGLTIWGGVRWVQREKGKAGAATTADNAVRVGLVASACAGAAHAMVSGVIVMPVSQVLLAVVAGWAWGRYWADAKKESARTPSAVVQGVFCVGIVLAVVTVGSSVRSLSGSEARRAAVFERMDRPVLWPRYWEQGYIGVVEPTPYEESSTARPGGPSPGDGG